MSMEQGRATMGASKVPLKEILARVEKDGRAFLQVKTSLDEGEINRVIEMFPMEHRALTLAKEFAVAMAADISMKTGFGLNVSNIMGLDGQNLGKGAIDTSGMKDLLENIKSNFILFYIAGAMDVMLTRDGLTAKDGLELRKHVTTAVDHCTDLVKYFEEHEEFVDERSN